MLSERGEILNDVETITAYANDMSDFLTTSELTESRAFIRSFVKEIVVSPGNAVVRYTIPMPDDSRTPEWTPRNSLYTARYCLLSRMVGLSVLYCELFDGRSKYESLH